MQRYYYFLNWQNLIWSASRTSKNVGRVGGLGGLGGLRGLGQVRRVGQVGQVRQVGELFGYRSLILRSLFALPVSLV